MTTTTKTPKTDQTNLPDVARWMMLTEDEVVNEFSNIEGAFTDTLDVDRRFVYIDGTRKDKVLLVAHADTMFEDGFRPKIGYKNGILYSNNYGSKYKARTRAGGTAEKLDPGIGADDRAGVAILWALKDLGHSLLITCGEELGCKTSEWLMQSDYWKKKLQDHQFMIQFDRKNGNELVFYDVASAEFADWLSTSTGYIPAQGGYRTDIRVLADDICAANVSVGYYREHTAEEVLVFAQWWNTLSKFYALLKQKNLPKFELPKSTEKRFKIKTTGAFSKYRSYDDEDWGYWNRGGSLAQPTSASHTPTIPTPDLVSIRKARRRSAMTAYELASLASTMITETQDTAVQCVACQTWNNQEVWIANKFKCTSCGK